MRTSIFTLRQRNGTQLRESLHLLGNRSEKILQGQVAPSSAAITDLIY